MDGNGSVTDRNPFVNGAAGSNYCRHDGAGLLRISANEPPTALTTFVHDSVTALVLNPQFTCVGAKSTVRQRSYRFGMYPAMAEPASTAALAHDLYLFTQEAPTIPGEFATMIASFEGPSTGDEEAFERLLWGTLQQLHDLDAPHYAWAADVSADPSDAEFSFSFAEMPFFVIGLHAASSRMTRRLAWPTLVFNPHRQFEQLKQRGRFERFRHVIREAEQRLQGDVNPMASDFGQHSEAAQYSGRNVYPSWKCPFASRKTLR